MNNDDLTNNTIHVYTTSSPGGLTVSASSAQQILDVTNNKARYYADLAKKYKEETKDLRDDAKYYAEQNADVTMEYVNALESRLQRGIDSKQVSGDYALNSDIPTNVSELTNDSQYVNSTQLGSAIDSVRLPSQTGKIGKFLTTDGTDASWSDVPVRNIGEIVVSTIPLTDAGLHLLDGALIQGSGIYSAFVDYITGLVTDYPNLFCTEADWQTSVTNYGVCGKFVYDNVNNTVRLPKITGIIEGTTDLTALGDLVQAGLPNISGQAGIQGNFQLEPTGVFYNGVSRNIVVGTTYGTNLSLSFDASRSSSIYGNSTTVQPQTIKVLYYIVIATSTKTEIEVDIDEIVTDLNGKADVDLTNITNTASTKMAHNAMLSNTKVSITIGAAGTQYTAPADGYYWATGTNGYIYLTNESVGVASMTQLGSGVVGHCNILVKKGDVVTLWYQGSTMSTFYFVYAEGSKWEAQ